MAYITVKQALDFEDLLEYCWCQAVDTLERVQEEGKENDLMCFLLDYFCSRTEEPTLTEVNDILRFEGDYIFEQLEIVDKYDIGDLQDCAFFDALVNYLEQTENEEMINLYNELLDEYGAEPTYWSTEGIELIEAAIKEEGLTFDKDGDIIED